MVHLPSLYLAAGCALLVAAASSASTLLKQRVRRGAWWWIGANAALVAALGLFAFADRFEYGTPIAAVLTLQWPISMLAGVRRFYSRGARQMPAWADGLVLGVLALAAVGTWVAPFEAAPPAAVFAVAMLLVSVYAAFAVSRLEDYATTTTLKSLLVAFALGAAVQAAALASSFTATPWSQPMADIGAFPALLMAALALLGTQVVLAMNHERHIAHLRASQRKLRHLADVDALTRLPNRRHFHELAERAISPARGLATVVVFDIDQLQKINEVLGHATGDEALRQVGTAMRETLRRRDVAGRMGGDEFAAVLPRTKVADADAVVARINAKIDDRQVAPRIARVVLNVGTTQMLSGETLADALRRAEIAMTTMRDERRRLAAQQVEIVAEAASLRLVEPVTKPAPRPVPRSSQLPELTAIPVGEVVMGQGMP